MVKAITFTTLVIAAVGSIGIAHATKPPEERCQAARYRAAGAYAACIQRAAAKFETALFSGLDQKFYDATAKCRIRYAKAWSRLQAKVGLAGTTCSAARFVDNGDGTVTDNLTALQWEKKTNPDSTQNYADPHDADNTYSWDMLPTNQNGIAADGTAFTSFLPALNSASFAGQSDWRLPSKEEIQTIFGDACGDPGCLTAIFGPTSGQYWTRTTYAAIPPAFQNVAWIGDFTFMYLPADNKGALLFVRAVRGGL
jgi:hypothetical protein